MATNWVCHLPKKEDGAITKTVTVADMDTNINVMTK
jgi:hypothetical protein